MINLANIFSVIKEDYISPSYSYHFKLISILFILLPFVLITGPFLPDLFLCLIGLYFLIISIKKSLFKYYQNKSVFIFSLFYLYLLIRGIFSEYPYESLIEYNGPIFYFRYLFFVLGIQYLLDTNPKLIKAFCFSLLIVLLFTIFDGYLQWIIGVNFFGYNIEQNRLSGLFGKEKILGHFLSHLVPLSLGLLIYIFELNKKNIILFMTFLVISEVLIFVSNDRAGFLKIFQFTLLLILLSNNFKLYRIITFCISLILIALILNFSQSSIKRYSATISDVSSTKIPYMPWTVNHELHFNVAYKMFESNPLFGQGPQLFRTLCYQIPEYNFGCTNHPHNYYFQTLGELGLVGLIFISVGFFYLLFILLKQFVKLWFRDNSKINETIPDYKVALFSLAFILFWPLIPHQSFYNNWLNVYVFLPFGFIFYFQKSKK